MEAGLEVERRYHEANRYALGGKVLKRLKKSFPLNRAAPKRKMRSKLFSFRIVASRERHQKVKSLHIEEG